MKAGCKTKRAGEKTFFTMIEEKQVRELAEIHGKYCRFVAQF
jgi:hypothetical protein